MLVCMGRSNKTDADDHILNSKTLKTVLVERILMPRPMLKLYWSATTPKLKFTTIGWFGVSTIFSNPVDDLFVPLDLYEIRTSLSTNYYRGGVGVYIVLNFVTFTVPLTRWGKLVNTNNI